MANLINSRNGTIFIVDISGYTRFVKKTENARGVIIMSQLLEEIMMANKLGFQVSEIEGDAILFYRFGRPLSMDMLLEQFEDMLSAFKNKLAAMKLFADHEVQLSIKAVAHYGEISQYKIFKFNKLYGQILIEAHRLLKNHIHGNTYLLVTDQYLNNARNVGLPLYSGFQQCEKYDVGKLCYTYFPFAGVRRVDSRLALVS